MKVGTRRTLVVSVLGLVGALGGMVLELWEPQAGALIVLGFMGLGIEMGRIAQKQHDDKHQKR
jgi:hypothetical protein